MPQLDVARREARCVIVYHGPRRAGKTETLQAIRHAVATERRGDVLSIPSGVHPAVFVEHLAVRLCSLADLRVHLHLYALPDHEALPLLGDLLRRADGVVFVADSDAQRARANRDALAALEDAAARSGVDLSALPFAFQWNKRDLPGAAPVSDLAFDLRARHRPGFSAVATSGEGVLLPLRDVALGITSRLAAHPAAHPAGRVVALPSFQGTGRRTRDAA
jgi:signal recognition particle receptor subunit beta